MLTAVLPLPLLCPHPHGEKGTAELVLSRSLVCYVTCVCVPCPSAVAASTANCEWQLVWCRAIVLVDHLREYQS